ncbi:hypothetical protein B7463_g10163, partial [Scytalidium lignicola]
MLSTPFILAAGSLFTLISGAPVPSLLSRRSLADVASSPLEARDIVDYIVFGGEGSVSEGWPSQDQWVSDFNTLFDMNTSIMKGSCSQWGVPNNSDQELSDMSAAIQSVASETGVDARFILAIILQESNGCVRAPTTNYGVRNPGLMQDHNGSGTCNDGSVQNPCPSSEIKQMITDGVAGTSSGDGLKQCIAESGATDVSMYYKAARIYNSGSIPPSKNLGDGVATHCYVSDVANRLLGWGAAPNLCNPNVIATITGIVGSIPKKANNNPAPSAPAPVSSAPAPPPAPTTTSAPVAPTKAPAPAPPPAAPPAAPSTPPAAPAQPSGASTSPAPGVPVYPWAQSNCAEYYTVKAGDYCYSVEQQFNLASGQLIQLNTGLDAACSNLWLGYQYCVKSA